MPSIKQFSENGPVGVPNRCCTTAGAHIRALTARHPIKPTSPCCPSAWQPNPADPPFIDAEILFRQPGPALKFEGLPLRAVIVKIGEPIDERTNAGRKVYIWGTPGTVNNGDKGKCQITATMEGDVIASLDYQGDELLCQRYAARLRP